MVYALGLLAALVVATGEVVQQRVAAAAPPEDNLSPRLLLWLARQPRWLAGVAGSLLGNVAFAAALVRGNVLLVEAIFLVRLIFALAIAAVWARRPVGARDLGAALLLTAALVVFAVAASPSRSAAPVRALRWAWGAGGPFLVVAVLTVVASRFVGARRALLLGAAAGICFGVQAGLVQRAMRYVGAHGFTGLLQTWSGYTVVVVALVGMFLVQSAFESAPLRASYPAVVVAQLVTATFLGVAVLGGGVRAGAAGAAAAAAALLAMVGGVVVLGRSTLVVGDRREVS